MKKIFLTIAAILLLSPISASALTISNNYDDANGLNDLVGRTFDLSSGASDQTMLVGVTMPSGENCDTLSYGGQNLTKNMEGTGSGVRYQGYKLEGPLPTGLQTFSSTGSCSLSGSGQYSVIIIDGYVGLDGAGPNGGVFQNFGPLGDDRPVFATSTVVSAPVTTITMAFGTTTSTWAYAGSIIPNLSTAIAQEQSGGAQSFFFNQSSAGATVLSFQYDIGAGRRRVFNWNVLGTVPVPATEGAFSAMIAASQTGFLNTTGATVDEATGWTSDNLIKVFIGAALATLLGLIKWIVALIVIAAIVYFAYRGLRFYYRGF